jgi:hypothetical protein
MDKDIPKGFEFVAGYGSTRVLQDNTYVPLIKGYKKFRIERRFLFFFWIYVLDFVG